jgi:predicted cupin superfamily sugar epimerase
VDATEIWLWHAGAPVSLMLRDASGERRTIILGADIAAGERPQGVVPAYVWQAAAADDGWALVSCVVAPEFIWEGFDVET